MVTITDIARLSGVAKSTVSRFLNGGSVGAATAAKIERIIQETGYAPNSFAQSLKAKKTNIIGTIVPRLDSFTASQTMIGIDEKLKEMDCEMLIANSNQDVHREIENIFSFARQKVGGIILLATQMSEAHAEALNSLNIPIILVGQQKSGIPSIIHDDEHSAYDMGNLVLSKKHRKIAYLGVTETDRAVGVLRKQGFARAMRKAQDADVTYYETSFDMEDAEQMAEKIIRMHKPTAFVCATDNIALGVLKAATRLGINVPGELSITGFGGYEVGSIVHPGLTTVRFFYKEAGKLAAAHILKLVNGEEIDAVTLSKYEIIERGSLDTISKTDL
ncbi:LacI family DNA-binding transcriptional regulator [Paenibacillus sp. Marseille-Q4541]|uniref:LacI family DNA-binding transcriptional regulator n=1 Tax=Paenibacillus sp. Marseille-Q4541 TaxID=2831522 RepID=UPI001BA86A0B|nr:LacI family DNA-binding transcriptional regulator [Paenibacillus sp. Marseille-Q4541]